MFIDALSARISHVSVSESFNFQSKLGNGIVGEFVSQVVQRICSSQKDRNFKVDIIHDLLKGLFRQMALRKLATYQQNLRLKPSYELSFGFIECEQSHKFVSTPILQFRNFRSQSSPVTRHFLKETDFRSETTLIVFKLNCYLLYISRSLHHRKLHFCDINSSCTARLISSFTAFSSCEPDRSDQRSNCSNGTNPIRPLRNAHLRPRNCAAYEIHKFKNDRKHAKCCEKPAVSIQRFISQRDRLPVYKSFLSHILPVGNWQNRNTQSIGGGK